MKAKKVISSLLVTAMAVTMLAGCGSSTATAEAPAAEAEKVEEAVDTADEAVVEEVSDAQSLEGISITFLNSKGEIQTAMEDLAVAFEDETGIKVEILSCGTGESPYTKITSAYNSGTAPTMAMLDPTDVEALALEFASDLSNEKWVAECETNKIDGKVYGFPFCIEGRGLIYNKKNIEDTLGTAFDPASINSYDALADLLKSLRDNGMQNPVVISKEDWSLGNHQLGYIYDTYDGTTAGSAEVIGKLKDGSLKVEDYDRFGEFIDTFNLLAEYNINQDDPLGAIYDQDPIFLVDGDAAIWANGSWAWPNLADAGAEASDEYGFLPYVLGSDTSAVANNGIQAGATKQVMIDGKQATAEEVAAAKEFLNWMVYSSTGQQMLVQDVAIIPACSNNSTPALDPLSIDIQNRMKAGTVYPSVFIAPGDHWSVLGASMQKYLAGESTKEELAADIDAYWTSQE